MSFSDFHAAWPLACAAASTKDNRIENLKYRFDDKAEEGLGTV